MSVQNSNILVTNVSSFVGKPGCRALLDGGANVLAHDRSFADADTRATFEAEFAGARALAAQTPETLVAEAAEVQNESNHLVRFTRAIKDAYPLEERVVVIEMLWEIVYADGILHDYEANLLRRVSGLLYVPDRDQGEARKRVLGRISPSTEQKT